MVCIFLVCFGYCLSRGNLGLQCFGIFFYELPEGRGVFWMIYAVLARSERNLIFEKGQYASVLFERIVTRGAGCGFIHQPLGAVFDDVIDELAFIASLHMGKIPGTFAYLAAVLFNVHDAEVAPHLLVICSYPSPVLILVGNMVHCRTHILFDHVPRAYNGDGRLSQIGL